MAKKENGIIRKIFGYSIASWFSALISFIVVPISSHIYSADDFGKINFFLSVGSICYTVLCLGLDQGYIRFYSMTKEENSRRQLLSFDLLLVFSVLLTVSVLAVPFWRYISLWLFGEETLPLLMMLPCYVAGLLAIRFFSTRYRMEEDLPRYTFLTILLGLATKGIYLLSVPLGRNYRTAVLFCGAAGDVFLLLMMMAQRKALAVPAAGRNRGLFLAELKFSLPLIPAMLMSLLNNNIPQFMLRAFDGFDYLAGYSVAVTVATALNVIQTGFNTFWTPYVFQNHETKQRQIQKIHRYIVTLMPLLAMGIVLFQDVIFLVVNEDYRYITQFLPFLILTPLCYTIGETTCVGIALRMKTGWNMCIYALSALVNCLSCLMLIPTLGPSGGAISAGIGAVTALILKTILGQKYYCSMKSVWPMAVNVTVFVAMAVLNLIFFGNPRGVLLTGFILVSFCVLPHNFSILKEMLCYMGRMRPSPKTDRQDGR